jgi:hypothetical protein
VKTDTGETPQRKGGYGNRHKSSYLMVLWLMIHKVKEKKGNIQTVVRDIF